MTITATRPPSQSAQITCVCCEKPFGIQSQDCPGCHAPADLSKVVAERGVPPKFVSVIGPSGAGKTVYLGMLLDMLSKGTCSLRGLPNGPFSLDVQQETIRALEQQRFPEKTPTEADEWRWVHCEVAPAKRPKRIVDVVTPDLAGEAIALELEHESTYPVIRSVLSKSAGLLVLFDSAQARDDGRTEDIFAMKLVSYLANLFRGEGPLRWRKNRLPIAIIYTKADACPEAMEDPQAFAHATMPGFVQGCDRHFARHQYFASGIVGSYAMGIDGYGRKQHMPLHIEPRGIIEPLEWLMEQV